MTTLPDAAGISATGKPSDNLIMNRIEPSGRRAGWRYALIWICSAATLVISPMFWLGQASGHDFQFHLASWMEVSLQWRAGIFYPRWAEWANYGFGEPRFIFYPPASWMLGAGLGSVLSWRVVPGTVVWLSLIAAGFGMFVLARQYLPVQAAIVAAVFYAVNPYHLVIAYMRSDFAELMASALLPLAIYFTLDHCTERRRRIGAFACVFAAIWLCNAPAAVVITYALGGIFIFQSVGARSFQPLIDGAIGFLGGFALSAFYLMPAAFERKWVSINLVVLPTLSPEHNFLFARSNDPDFVAFNSKVSIAAVGVMALCFIAAYISRTNPAIKSAWATMMFLGLLSSMMMLPISGIAWRYLPELHFVQFPWRWLVPLNLACWFLFAAATANARGKKWIWSAMTLVIALGAIGLIRTTWWDSEDIHFISNGILTSHGYEGVDEYTPIDCDRESVPDHRAGVEFVEGHASGDPAAHIVKWRPEEKLIRVATDHPTTISLKLLNYPAWKAEVNGEAVEIESGSEYGEVQVHVPQGESLVRVRFTRTADRFVGGTISIAAVFAVGFVGFWKSPRRESRI